MVSEWMVNGNINEFVKAHTDVNRFELVGFWFLLLTSLVADNHFVIIVERRCPRPDVHAW